jgi:hypothetical protein
MPVRRGRAAAAAILLTAVLTAEGRLGHAAEGAGGDAAQICVDVRIGQEPFFSCLNEQLRRLADQSHGPVAQPTVTATSPAPAVGTYNQAATRERMGTAFGVSAFPQRPPPPVFSNPLVNPAAR